MATQSQSAAAASLGDLNRNSLFDLKGRVALVTGGGTGIGLMVTQALAANGAKVYITGRSADKLDRVVEVYAKDVEGEIIALSGFDVTSKESISKLVKEIESREKCLCILVNNAGINNTTVTTETKTAQEMKENLFDAENSNFEDWASVYSTNVAGIFFTSGSSFWSCVDRAPLTLPTSCLPTSSRQVDGAARRLVWHHPQHHLHQWNGSSGSAPLCLQRLQGSSHSSHPHACFGDC